MSIVLVLLISFYQIGTFEFEIIDEASAINTWHDTDWSDQNNYSYISKLDIKSTGELKLSWDREIFVSDVYNYRIVKTRFDGAEWKTLGTRGSGKKQFYFPGGIDYDNNTGNIYVVDMYNYRLVKTKINGSNWTTLGSQGSGTGQFNYPFGLHFDNTTEDLYITDFLNNRIVKTKMNGSGWKTYGSQGSTKGKFYQPTGIHYDSDSGFIYVADYYNHRIVRTRINGSGWKTYGSQGSGQGQFVYPAGIFYDNTTGFIYVSDIGNHRVVKTKINGSGWTKIGKFGGGKRRFYYPMGLTYDYTTGYIYVADYGNHRIVRTKIDGKGWKGYGKFGTGNGQFYYPYDVALGSSGYCPDGFISSRHHSFNASGNFTILNWTAVTPPETWIKFQLRSASSSSKLTTKPFVGPNGSVDAYYTQSDTKIWPGHYSDRWIQYKAYFSSTNSSKSPILKDVSIDYNALPYPPIPITPENNSWLSGNIPMFSWNFFDLDSSIQVSYQVQIGDTFGFLDINYDSGMVQSSTSSFTPIESLPDGIWYWRVRTKDSFGDWGAFSLPWKFYIDTKPPNSTIMIPENNRFYNNLISIAGTAFDQGDGIGVVNVEITIKRLGDDQYWNGSDWQSNGIWLSTNGTTEWKYNSGSVNWTSDVQFEIQSRAIDNLTNIETPISSIIFNFDSEKPSSTIEFPMNNSHVNALPVVSGKSIDIGGAGVEKVEICIFDCKTNTFWNEISWNSFENWIEVEGTKNWTFDTSKIPLESGRKYIIISKATDNISNVEIPDDECTFTFDKKFPTSSIYYPIDNSILNNLNSISGEASDTGGSVIEKVEIFIKNIDTKKFWDGNEWVSKENWLFASGNENWSFNATNISWITDNYYKIQSRASDLAKNIEFISPEVKFMYDDKPPEITISINKNDELTNITTVNLQLKSEDTGSGVTTMALSNDSIVWQNWTTFIKKIKFELLDGDGEQYVYLKVQDSAGNIAGPINDSIILDLTPPQNLSIIINNKSKYTKSNLCFLKLAAVDLTSGIMDMSFSFDRKSWTAWEPFKDEKSINLPSKSGDGKKDIYLRVNDYAGNIAIESSSIIFDTTPPHSLSIKINNDTSKTNSTSVILELYAEDDLSIIKRMSFSTDNNTWTHWAEYSEEMTFELPAGNGIKTIYFRVHDTVGNVAMPVSDDIKLKIEIPPPDEPSKRSIKYISDSMYFILLIVLIIIIIAGIVLIVIHKRKKSREQEAMILSKKKETDQSLIIQEQYQITLSQAEQQIPPVAPTLQLPPVGHTYPVPATSPQPTVQGETPTHTPASPKIQSQTQETPPPQSQPTVEQGPSVILPSTPSTATPITTPTPVQAQAPGLTPEQQEHEKKREDGESN